MRCLAPLAMAGKVKAIAIGGKQRIAQLPDVPTLAETYPGFEQTSWFGLLAPAGIRKEISMRVWKEMARTLEVPEVRQRLAGRGFDVRSGSAEAFLRFVQGESAKLGKLIRRNRTG